MSYSLGTTTIHEHDPMTAGAVVSTLKHASREFPGDLQDVHAGFRIITFITDMNWGRLTVVCDRSSGTTLRVSVKDSQGRELSVRALSVEPADVYDFSHKSVKIATDLLLELPVVAV